MKLKGVLFLAGYTARAQAYAQAIGKNELNIDRALFFGTTKQMLPGQLRRPLPRCRRLKGLFAPNFSESLDETAARYRWNAESVSADNVNDTVIYEKIVKLKPLLIIYSGYGGQLVGKDLIQTGAPFLHMHSGWLPDYKGSTTLYYGWLEKNFCGVSAILLNENIDEGAIVARRKYPPPPRGVDPDYVYDSVIRADLLVTVLKTYVRSRGVLKTVPQGNEGRVYFVIHPVLKHLARLRKTRPK